MTKTNDDAKKLLDDKLKSYPELVNIQFQAVFTQTPDVYGLSLKPITNSSQALEVLALKTDGDWVMALSFEQFLKLAKQSGYFAIAHCPYCNGNNLYRWGKTEKTFQRYKCRSCAHTF